MSRKVVIDIQNKERIYINPYDGTQLPRITRGITGPSGEANHAVNLGEDQSEDSSTEGTGETGETQTQ